MPFSFPPFSLGALSLDDTLRIYQPTAPANANNINSDNPTSACMASAMNGRMSRKEIIANAFESLSTVFVFFGVRDSMVRCIPKANVSEEIKTDSWVAVKPAILS